MNEKEIKRDLEHVTINCVGCETPIGTTRGVKEMIEDINEVSGVVCDECE